MPAVKQKINDAMKMEQNPLVYLEYTPVQKPKFKLKNLFKASQNTRFCMGYVSHPYESTFRITTCRHLISNPLGEIPSKADILAGLEVFARYEGVHKKLHSLMLEDVNIKIHDDELVDILFIEITHPDNYNFQLLNQAEATCRKRFPGSRVYYFQHPKTTTYFTLLEGTITPQQIYITGITNDGNFFFTEERPAKHYRVFQTIDTIKKGAIQGASGSPILSRQGEVVGMICAHAQAKGKGIYLSIEKIERLYKEIKLIL